MGKEWLMIFLLAFANDPIAKTDPPRTTPPATANGSTETKTPTPAATGVDAAKAPPPQVKPKCDVGPFKSLVGRTIGDVMTLKLPPGTRIYRLGDPVTQPITPGRLNIEINRGTRVGRIYCS
ncbi:hypothetical protein [Aquidulcibacter sp.]|jgi:hypothetical protein|uniref:hypothetical protein n=1 Tax=Aquidulcibacter sp. TaxID=2052990 RepID=UPI00378316CE